LHFFHFFISKLTPFFKVEFPDAKILEEIFVNAVLFESKDRDLSDSQACTPVINHQIISDDDLEDIGGGGGGGSRNSTRGGRSGTRP
jgi:hypothetical protein